MDKRIVVELDKYGWVVGVWCPDEDYEVHILDRSDRALVESMERNGGSEVAEYYRDLEKIIKELKDCLE